jgi:predicted  nucleic acid-binding Zn-ribbon protein
LPIFPSDMSNKTKKKSSKDFAETIVSDLTSDDNDNALFEALLYPDKAAEKPASDPSNSSQFISPTSILNAAQKSVAPEAPANNSEKTSIVAPPASESSVDISDKTVVVGAARIHGGEPVQEKVSFGVARPSTRSPQSPTAALTDSQLQQAENLRVAQERLTELEKELEKLRGENEQLSSTSEAAKEKTEELAKKLDEIEREKSGLAEQYRSEMDIYRDGANAKDSEILKLRAKVEELENRLRQDLRKIRVRERELENRLELTKMEKDALLKAKDESILDLKRKLDQVTHELDNYRHRVSELNGKIENNHEQLSRTVRALRLALTNLEVSDNNSSLTVTPLRKAE